MEPGYIITASSVVVTILLGVWRISASHNKRTDQLRGDVRADMERMEANRRADMERIEANMDEFRRETFTILKELLEAVAKLDSRVSYIEGILDRRSRREAPPLDISVNPA